MSDDRRGAATPSQPDANLPILPAERAFVVQFAAGEDSSGRIEHVVSGRGARFEDRERLLGFMAEILANLGNE